MIPLLAAEYYDVSRTTESYVDGVPVRTVDASFQIWATVEPMSQFELSRAPEGLRATHGIRIFAARSVELRTQQDPTPGAPGAPADEILVGGLAYQIHRREPYPVGAPLSHTEYVAYASSVGRGVSP